MTLDEYIEAHIDAEGDYLHRLWRATQLHLNYPRMASGHVQGRVLKMLVQMIRPKTVLEIGTFTGYSALCMAEGLADGAVLHTVEINDEQEDFTRPWLEGSPWADKIQLHIGDALQLLDDRQMPDSPLHGLKFDLVFIDADKRHYTDYYEAVLPRLNEGGYILADNTLWDGHVVQDDVRESDLQTQGILAFNDHVAADPRVEKVILPVRDGLTIIRLS
ncbi:MAG: class I SAM-dependent methyltransferase [Bacteroidaceae bacterium]|nr:class I SAM-dependent methyltransferase [Bacteroidaceae bacterium]